MASIAIIDYGMGNLRSVAKALEFVAPDQRIVVSQRPEDIRDADRVVFPGQGAIRDCMRELAQLELIEVVREAAASKPFLGLCLGPQALLSFSEENGGVSCLDILPGRVRWFGAHLSQDASKVRPKIPHMGWNEVWQLRPHALWGGIAQGSRFYFVHSYYLEPEDAGVIIGKTSYIIDFASVIAHDNIFAVQFHPEKSARWGLRLLANFSRWSP
jgi:glutamine amidotransferase